MEDRIVTIEKVVFGGKGLSRDLEKVVFVPYTLAGEKVRIRIRKSHTDYLEGEAVEIVEASPDRVPPDCRYYGDCGGCQLSHTGYERQLLMKTQMLQESLRRNQVPYPEIQVQPSEPFGYRHRARIKYDARNYKMGFFRSESNIVVDIQECLCLTSGLNQLLNSLRRVLLTSPVRRLTEIDCYENESGRTAIFPNAPIPPPLRQELERITTILSDEDSGFLTVEFRKRRFPMHPSVFLQVNPGMWKAMIHEVESHHENVTGGTVLELYCGTGFFTVPLSAKFEKIVACEENPSAIRYARANHSEKNIEWNCVKAEDFAFPEKATTLIADPPRPGLAKKVLEKVLRHGFHSLTYVSCNCSSLARDLKALSQRYRIDRITLLDLFPQTYHFETIVHLQKKDS